MLIDILKTSGASQDNANGQVLLLLTLKAAKVLSRKQCNRLWLGEQAVRPLVTVLQTQNDTSILAEAANVLLNLCYEVPNVKLLLSTDGPASLLALLAQSDSSVRANAAGALQSICYQQEGTAGSM